MKAIDLLKKYRSSLLITDLKVEIRSEDWTQKVVIYWNLEELEKEELLQHEIKDWFIGSRCTDGNIVINLKDSDKNE